MASNRKKATATGAGAPRGCPSCDARLASDNKGRICSPCESSGRGLRDDQEVVDFALDLHLLRQTLGVLGLDYIFSHQFLNRELQEELAELRQALYNKPEPPRPLSLRDAARWAVQTELADTRLAKLQYELANRRRTLYHKPEPLRLLSLGDAAMSAAETELDDSRLEELLSKSPTYKLISETSLSIGTDRLLLRGFDKLRWLAPLRRHADAVSQRLRELEDELPAAIGTLHLALVCGTPPLPPGIRALTELRLVPQVGSGAGARV